MNDEMKDQIRPDRNIIIKKQKTHDKKTYIYALIIVFVLLISFWWAYLSQGFAGQTCAVAQICSFCISALISFIPAILLSWRIEFVHVKLENERFQKLRINKLSDILSLVCSFFCECALASNKTDHDEILSWRDWHARYLECLKLNLIAEESMQMPTTAELLKIHADNIYEETMNIKNLYAKVDIVMHDLFEQKEIKALVDLGLAVHLGRGNHDTFTTYMEQAIAGVNELSFLSKPFSISELGSIKVSFE